MNEKAEELAGKLAEEIEQRTEDAGNVERAWRKHRDTLMELARLVEERKWDGVEEAAAKLKVYEQELFDALEWLLDK